MGRNAKIKSERRAYRRQIKNLGRSPTPTPEISLTTTVNADPQFHPCYLKTLSGGIDL